LVVAGKEMLRRHLGSTSAIASVSAATKLNRLVKLHGGPDACADPTYPVLVEEIALVLTSAGPQSLASTAWSFAKLRFKDAPLLNALASAALAKIAHFGPQELANTAWAVSRMKLRDEPLRDAIAS
jgi:hypothetical protein